MTPLLLVLSLLCLAESRISYSGEQVLKCPLKNSSVVQQLWEELDVWGVLPDNTIDVRVKNLQEKRFLESVLDGCKPIIDDVEQEVRKWEAARATASADWFSSYHTYDELDSWYTNFSKANGDIMDYVPIGNTFQNNTIKALIINVGKTPKPTVYMQALIHAREWAAGTTLNYVLNQLVADFRAGFGNATSLLSKINLHAVPVLNIDGYKFTWSGDRLWRKNRRPNTDKNSACFGTDVNRNYNDHWGMGGSSATPCSDTYMGPSVASELETKATQSYFKSIAPVVYGIDWHCYSQLVLRPYGWTSANSPDETVLAQRGAAYAQTIKDTSGRTYTSQKSIDLYVTTGTASDWFYGDDATGTNSGRRAAGYTVELRPTGSNPGFELPPIEITPCGVENYNAVLPMLNYFASNPLIPSN